MLVGQGDRRIPVERRLSCQEFKQEATRRVDIRSFINGLAACLFRGEILRRTNDSIRLGHCGLRICQRPGNAEVHDFNFAAIRQHDVSWLDVTMNQPGRVCILQGIQDPAGNLNGLGNRHGGSVAQELFYRVSLHVLHNDVGNRDDLPI